MTNKLVLACGLGIWVTVLPLRGAGEVAENGPKQSFQVSRTERMPFAPGRTIRLIDSYGYLSVDGWDEPEVEITVTKSTNHFYEPSEKKEAEARLNRIGIATERHSDTELAITTTRASRHGNWSPPLPPTTEAGVTVEYQIHVPRNSHLVIHHDNGYIWVSDVTGEIEVNSHTGDMIVSLPDAGPYSIDAKTRVGSVSSDFAGKGMNQYVLGMHFSYAGEPPSRRVYLRMGRGSITILKSPPSAPDGKN